MNISLPPALPNVVNAKVASGFYSDANEVVCKAIPQFSDHFELFYELKLLNLRNTIAEGVKQIEKGEVEIFTIDDIINELDKT